MSEIRENMETLLEGKRKHSQMYKTSDQALAKKAKKVIAAAERDLGKQDPRMYVDLVLDNIPALKGVAHAKRVLALMRESVDLTEASDNEEAVAWATHETYIALLKATKVVASKYGLSPKDLHKQVLRKLPSWSAYSRDYKRQGKKVGDDQDLSRFLGRKDRSPF